MTDGRTAAQKSLDRFRVTAGLAILCMFAVVGLSWLDNASDNDRQDANQDRLERVQAELADAVQAIEDQRATARVSSCNQAVDFAVAHNELVRRSQDLLRAVAAGSTRPETQAFVDEQVALYDANIVRVRDCSPQGLEDFANGTGGYLP